MLYLCTLTWWYETVILYFYCIYKYVFACQFGYINGVQMIEWDWIWLSKSFLFLLFKTSLYTILDLMLSFSTKISCLSGVPTRYKPTYNCPREKHCCLRSMLIRENFWPWDLLIVRTKEILKAPLLNGMGKPVGTMSIRGIYACCITAGPVKKAATTIFSLNSFISSLVPLHMLGGHEFLNTMMELLTFKGWLGGKPEGLNEYKNSRG